MGDDSAVDELIRRPPIPRSRPSRSARRSARPWRRSPRRSPRCRGDAPAPGRGGHRRTDAAGRGRDNRALCGTLVERGLDPTIALGPILDRLESQIAPDAIAFVAACRQAAEDEPRPVRGEGPEQEDEATEQADPVEQHGERIAALMPTEAQSFHALEPISWRRSRCSRGRSRPGRPRGRGPPACIARRARRPVRLRRPALDDDAGARRRADRGAAPRARQRLPGPDLGAGRQLPAAHPAGRRADRPVLEPLAPRPVPGVGPRSPPPATGRSARAAPPPTGPSTSGPGGA